MRDPHKYTWADPYRDEARWSPGRAFTVVFGISLLLWAGVVLLAEKLLS